MNTVATLIDDVENDFDSHVANSQGAASTGKRTPPIKCLLMDDNVFDRQQIRRTISKSRYDISLVETGSILETRERLAHQPTDILLADYRVPDGNGIHFAGDVIRGGKQAPQVIVVTGESDPGSAIEAIRAGAADYLPKSEITPDLFDAAIENALRARGRATKPDEMAPEDVVSELKSLRKMALNNVSEIKAAILPLMASSWQISQGKLFTPDQRTELKATVQQSAHHIPALLDAITVAATCGPARSADIVSDFSVIVRDIVANDRLQTDDRGVKVTCSKLPTLKICPKRSRLLIESLINAAVQFCPLGKNPEIAIGSARDPKGNPIIWVRDNGVPLGVRKNTLGTQMTHHNLDNKHGDPFIWSMCQLLAEGLGAELRIRTDANELTTVMLRFQVAALA